MAMSMLELRRTAQQLNRIRTAVADYRTIKRIIESMIEEVRTLAGSNSGGELYFRAQRLPFKPTKIEHLGAPPAELVTGFQRCNAPGEPRLYTASRRITALLELGVRAGETIYLSQWIGNEGLPVCKMFHGGDDDPNIATAYGAREFLVHSVFESFFTRPIHQVFSHEYKITSAIANQLMSNFTPAKEFNIADDGLVGLRYPSVIDLKGSYNSVFHPSFIFDRMRFMHCMEVHVEKIEGDKISISVIDSAVRFKEGLIDWMGDPQVIPEPRGDDRGAKFVYNETGWEVVTVKGPTPPGIIDVLLEE